MALIVGVSLALLVGLMATVVGLDRDRAFYPTVAMVVASYYALFAAMGAPTGTLVIESGAAAAFVIAAAAGFRSSLWIVVAALAAHGAFDLVHHAIIPNPGVPSWWPEFCSAYDVSAALYLAWLIRKRRQPGHRGLGDPQGEGPRALRRRTQGPVAIGVKSITGMPLQIHVPMSAPSYSVRAQQRAHS